MSVELFSPSSHRALRLRARRDLIVRPLQFGGQEQWGVKDPISLRYFQLQDEEYFLLQRLDGTRSPQGLLEEFNRRFAPHSLTPQELASFTASLHDQGLVIADATGQAELLLKRRDEQTRRAWLERATGLLAMRFRGVDPDAFLNALYPYVAWFFSPIVFVAMLALIGSALGLAVSQFDVLQTRLPGLQDFFTPQNILLLSVTLAVVKVCHEMGHAFTCKHFGGECHEFGLMLLVFTPCLYVNVTDAWLIKNKWSRAAIGAGGIYVELILASVCTYLWWFSQPGLLNSICLNVMVICSVNTVIFNGNPLLRYDGYFILADLTESPNLWQQATAVVKHYFATWVLDIAPVSERLLPPRNHGWLALYFVAAMCYRVFVLCTILWLLHQVLKPYGAQAAVHLIALASIVGMTGPAVYRLMNFLRQPRGNRSIRWPRFWLVTLIILAVAAGVAMIPLPFRVAAPVVLEPANAARVFVSHPGVLQNGVKYGEPVKRGDLIAELADLELSRKVVVLAGQVREQKIIVAQLYKRRVIEQGSPMKGPVADESIRAAEKKLDGLSEALKALERRQKQLNIVAPQAGVVMPPEEVRRPAAKGELAEWTGAPLQKENRGALLSSQTTLCSIGDPQLQDAVLAVNQADITSVMPGQTVAVRLDQTPGITLWGKVTAISEIDLQDPPPHLVATGATPVRTNERGEKELLETMYQVRVKLDAHQLPLTIRAIGQGRIYTPPQSIATLTYRYLSRTFNFDF